MASGRLRPHGNTKYPWSDWADGHVHEIKASAFGVDAISLQQQILREARRRGMRATTRSHGGVVSFQFRKVRKKATPTANPATGD